MSWRAARLIHVERQRFHRKCMQCARYVSQASAVHDDPSNTRNFALVAHIDSGKTTLTESILSKSGYLAAPGSVDTGSTTTDFLPAERERGITIQSASIPVAWKKWKFNLIDTPGHADFGMEVESASRVVDGAIVLIDSVEGVESQTQGVWRQLDRYNVGSRILFLNKMDRSGASFRSSLLSILNYQLHAKPVALTLPVASFSSASYAAGEPGIEGLVDLVQWMAWKWDAAGNSTPYRLPNNLNDLKKSGLFDDGHPLVPHLISARSDMLENLSMFSEKLMDKLLVSVPSDYLSIGSEEVMPALRKAVLSNEIVPVLCGAASKHIGTGLVLDYAGELFPSPLDRAPLDFREDANVQLLAWKVGWDSRRGWMTFVRVYSGKLTKSTILYNVTRQQREKISKLLLLYADQPEVVDELPFGSVGVILGLKHTRTGDTLVSTVHGVKAHQQMIQSAHTLQDISLPPAVMSASIIPCSKSDVDPVQDALLALSRTDPSARVETLEGQLLVHGLGALHLEIIETRLRDEWKVNFESGKRRVSYREAFGGNETRIQTEFVTEMQGKTVTIPFAFRLRNLREGESGDASWDGNIVVCAQGQPLQHPSIAQDMRSPWTYVAQGVSSAISASPHTSFPLSRAHVQIENFVVPEGVGMSVLASAASSILRSTWTNSPAGPIMEPYIRFRIVIPDNYYGKVMKDIVDNDGELLGADSHLVHDGRESTPYPRDGVYIPPEWLSPSAFSLSTGHHGGGGGGQKCFIHAVAPLSKMLDFSNRLRALSGGHGTFEMSSAGFRAVNDTRKTEIMREMGRA